MTTQKRRFQVALSFPGEKRDFVSHVADHLSQALGRDNVFYDDYCTAELARPDLDLHLGRIYHDDSELVVPFYCAPYERKQWCRLEWRQMRDILFNLEGHRIMPFRFDDAPIPGVLSIDGYVKIGKRSPQEVAELILLRLSGSPDERPGTGIDFLLSNTREPPKATNPATLLNARYEVVPFFEEARVAELADLQAWCDDESIATSVRLFHGPGGTGKTRLFIEWTKRLRAQGWFAGFLPEQVEEEWVESLLRADQAVLVVLDYAECRAGLFEFLKRTAERAAEEKQRLRVALLARQVADWWQSLLRRDEAVRHFLAQAEPVPIAPVTPAGALRRRLWEEARDAFAACMRKSVPSGAADLGAPRFGRVLYLHMAALAVVEGLDAAAESLVGEIVVHEKHFWAKRYQEQFEADDFEAADFDKRSSRLVAGLTLLGGMPSREAAEELNRRVEGPDPRYKHLVSLLRSLYPGREQGVQDRYLGGLEPDLLGETLVWSVLTDPENVPETFLERVFAGAREEAVTNGFIVLGRISPRDPRNTTPWLATVLEADIGGRARPAFLAALVLGSHTAFSPLGVVMADALEREGTLDHAMEFDPLVPEQTVSLREVAVWTGRRLLEFLSTQENRPERARLLNNLGARLGALGRREEAWQAAQEAVEIRRRLAQDRPDAFLPALAMSLNNLGARLSDLGQREEALQVTQEAVDIHRQLAKSRPDTFSRDMAMSLTNLGYVLGELGRWEEALEATEEAGSIDSRLAEEHPDAFLPSLAADMNNLAGSFTALGRREEALHAVQQAASVYERLANKHPDAFLPDLARSMSNVGNAFSALGREEEALACKQKAVDICRRLAKDRPEVFLPNLALSLNNLDSSLSRLGRREEAVNAAQEAVDIHRRFAEERPDAFLPSLASSLNKLSGMLRALGQREKALQAAQEAVGIYRRLAKDCPDTFSPNLAMSLNNLAGALSDLGQWELALLAARKAVDILKGLATDRPDSFLPDLAVSLNNLGAMFRERDRPEEALLAAEEAVGVLRRLSKDRPAVFSPNLAMALGNLANSYGDFGRHTEALHAAQEAVDIRRRLVKERPDGCLPDLAMSLNNLGKKLSDLGCQKEALNVVKEAINIYTQLAKGRPDAFLPELSRSLALLGRCLAADGRLREAVDAFAEGVRILAPFFSSFPQAFALLMGVLLSDYLSHAKELGESPDMEMLGPILAKFEELKGGS